MRIPIVTLDFRPKMRLLLSICVDAYHKMSDGPPRRYRNMEARTGEIVPEVCTPPGWKLRSPKALNDLGFSSKAILLSSASLANVRHGMEEAQGQCFAGKRRVKSLCGHGLYES